MPSAQAGPTEECVDAIDAENSRLRGMASREQLCHSERRAGQVHASFRAHACMHVLGHGRHPGG